jgi:hypothetical protein
MPAIYPLAYWGGKRIKLTPEVVMQSSGVKEKTARTRIKNFIEKKWTIDDVMTKPAGGYYPAREPRMYTRDGISLCSRDVLPYVDGAQNELAQRRLRRWEQGIIDCDQLYAPKQAYNYIGTVVGNEEWRALQDVKVQRDINTIPITQFERRFGEEAERQWSKRAKISREFR